MPRLESNAGCEIDGDDGVLKGTAESLNLGWDKFLRMGEIGRGGGGGGGGVAAEVFRRNGSESGGSGGGGSGSGGGGEGVLGSFEGDAEFPGMTGADEVGGLTEMEELRGSLSGATSSKAIERVDEAPD